jgi:hypothetical protein
MSVKSVTNILFLDGLFCSTASIEARFLPGNAHGIKIECA